MVRHLIAIGCILAGTAASAEPVRLSNQGIKDTIAGSILYIDTPLGTKLPVRYSDDGKLTGRAGGMVANYLGARSDSGRWWVSKNRLCHKWKRWFDAKPQCMRLQIAGRRILWRRDDGKTGTATIASRPTPVAKAESPPFALGSAKLGSAKSEKKPSDPNRFSPIRRAAPAAPPHAVPTPPPLTAPPPRLARAYRPSEAKPVIKEPSYVEPSFRVAGVEAYDVLNIRRGPSTDYAVVGAIPPNGRGVRIVGACITYWCPINHRGTTGWVSRIYLAEEMPAPGSPVRASNWFKTSQAR